MDEQFTGEEELNIVESQPNALQRVALLLLLVASLGIFVAAVIAALIR